MSLQFIGVISIKFNSITITAGITIIELNLIRITSNTFN